MRIILLLILILVLVGIGINYFIAQYSTGIGEVDAPTLVGLSTSEAFLKLTSLNLSGKVVGETYSEVPAGNIAKQEPQGNIKVKEGRIINLIISKGPKEIPLGD